MTITEASAQTTIPHDYSKRAMVFGGRSSQDLAAKIAGKLSLSVGDVTLKTFSDGEIYGRYEESIRGADVFLVQSTCANVETDMTPNDALMELMIMADAAQGASAHRIIAVMPWFGYARQDKKSAPREPITSRVVARSLEAVGIDRFIDPRATTVSTILQHIRRGRIKGLYSVSDGEAELIDAIALETSPLVNRPLKDAELPEGVMIGAVFRDGQVAMPNSQTVVKPGDRIVLMAIKDHVKDVEQMFRVSLDYF